MGAQGVVLAPDNRVILLRHTYRPGWHFPGGGVEKNETVLEALTRELEEEAGVFLAEPPQLFSIFANFDAFPNDHVALFIVRAWQQPKVPEPNHEIAEIGLFEPTALPEGTVGPVKRRLAEIIGGKPPAPRW